MEEIKKKKWGNTLSVFGNGSFTCSFLLVRAGSLRFSLWVSLHLPYQLHVLEHLHGVLWLTRILSFLSPECVLSSLRADQLICDELNTLKLQMLVIFYGPRSIFTFKVIFIGIKASLWVFKKYPLFYFTRFIIDTKLCSFSSFIFFGKKIISCFRHGLPWWLRDKEFTCQWWRLKRCGFDPWIGKIPWKRKW